MSDLLDAVHEMTSGLHAAGGMDKVTLRQIETLCIPQATEYSPEQIRALRENAHMSQRGFAALLNVGASTVRHWELGLKKPRGPSRRLLDVVARKGIQSLC